MVASSKMLHAQPFVAAYDIVSCSRAGDLTWRLSAQEEPVVVCFK